MAKTYIFLSHPATQIQCSKGARSMAALSKKIIEILANLGAAYCN
jgi:hypothetical protein